MPPPSPSQVDLAASPDQNPLANVPPLTTYTATSETDRVEALKLVGDSVAQQRQFANRQLIFHPLIVAIWVGLLAVAAQFLYKGHHGDLLLVGTTWAGLVMAVLLAIRLVTGGYIEIAEEIATWKWLGKDSEVVVTKFGDEIIGTVIFQFTKSDSNLTSPIITTTTTPPPAPTTSKRHRKSNSSPKHRALVRAWTVKQRYRTKGIGGGLLEEVVRICKSKNITPSAIEFADDHANARKVIPETGIWGVFAFNKAMDRKERAARIMLDTIVEEGMSSREKRRSWKERDRRGS
ncbi:putative gnat family [Phaeomoniella chlamydospora]|uniref:Putative gnat family n=1 Tax=Phaeomoniella chlamydospora TaxID=158046 RepID=A0A0G2HGY0_PHACM|nr:putative gnat family [Phaeomoniella chlamydospora]